MFGSRSLLITLLIAAAPSTSHQPDTHSNLVMPAAATQASDPHCAGLSAAACVCVANLPALSGLVLVGWPRALDPTPNCRGALVTAIVLTQVAALRTFPVAEAVCLALHLSQDPAFGPGVGLPLGLCSNLVRALSEYAASRWTVASVAFCNVVPPSPPTPTFDFRIDHDTLALYRTNTEARAL